MVSFGSKRDTHDNMLFVHAGTSRDRMQAVAVNDDSKAVELESDYIKARVTVRLEHYYDNNGEESINVDNYFNRRGGHVTWSIGMAMQFKSTVNADDLMWGNAWWHPIRSMLPFGHRTALQFVRLLDPTLRYDLHADEPYALSPLFATMQYMRADHLDDIKSSDLFIAEDDLTAFSDDINMNHDAQTPHTMSSNNTTPDNEGVESKLSPNAGILGMGTQAQTPNQDTSSNDGFSSYFNFRKHDGSSHGTSILSRENSSDHPESNSKSNNYLDVLSEETHHANNTNESNNSIPSSPTAVIQQRLKSFTLHDFTGGGSADSSDTFNLKNDVAPRKTRSQSLGLENASSSRASSVDPHDTRKQQQIAHELMDSKGLRAERQKMMSSKKVRSQINIQPDMVLTVDFCHGFINFRTLSLKIPGIEIPLVKFKSKGGLPITFVLRNRSSGDDYLYVSFDTGDRHT